MNVHVRLADLKRLRELGDDARYALALVLGPALMQRVETHARSVERSPVSLVVDLVTEALDGREAPSTPAEPTT
jgi:hypothetical protein